jgi:hypothetical protein
MRTDLYEPSMIIIINVFQLLVNIVGEVGDPGGNGFQS